MLGDKYSIFDRYLSLIMAWGWILLYVIVGINADDCNQCRFVKLLSPRKLFAFIPPHTSFNTNDSQKSLYCLIK